jgi:hypothetical protein
VVKTATPIKYFLRNYPIKNPHFTILGFIAIYTWAAKDSDVSEEPTSPIFNVLENFAFTFIYT